MPPIPKSRHALPPIAESLPPPTPYKSPPRKTPKKGSSIEPTTPNPTYESCTLTQNQSHDPLPRGSSLGLGSGPVARRRSLRLVGKSNCGSDGAVSSASRRRRRGLTGNESSSLNGECEFGLNRVGLNCGEEIGGLGLGSMNEVITASNAVSDEENCGDTEESRVLVRSEEGEELEAEKIEFLMDGTIFDSGSQRDGKKSGKRKSGDHLGLERDKEGAASGESGYLSLRSGTRIVKRMMREGKCVVRDELVGSGDCVGKEEPNAVGAKGNETMIHDTDDEGCDQMDNDQSGLVHMGSSRDGRKFVREERGKGKLAYNDYVTLNRSASIDLELKLGRDHSDLNVSAKSKSIINQPSPVDGDRASADGVIPLNLSLSDNPQPSNNDQGPHVNVSPIDYRLRQYRQIARESALKFARVTRTLDSKDSDDEREVPSEQEAVANMEDWPGPFSTAMKIIKNREKKGSTQGQNLPLERSGSASVVWTSRIDKGCQRKDRVAPMLQNLCMKVLAKNGDAITSLEYLPDVLRHKLSRMICNSRKMTGHCLDILFKGSPSEVRVTDCSSITEEQLARSFEHCDTGNLMVLELNQCGRCMPDYTLTRILASKRLPALTTISLQGACRLSDVGLTELISSAPALRSINLSQCSLLTDVGINAIAMSLGPVLRELYLDDCQNLNAMLILPALKNLEHLEVLSLAGIPSVSDAFLKELIRSNGQGMKDLVLANCIKLTDKSLKVIGETCLGLCALDLANVTKLSDFGIGYLTNGCPEIQTLKLCRNMFSDEAVAAFLETSGESLKELSLNNVSKVGAHSAMSLGRRCKNLQSLDVSWCRNLTDEALGLIADSCSSLRVLKVFGCTQITKTFLEGHSNPNLRVIGMKLTPILEHLKEDDYQQGPLCYTGIP